VYDDKGLDFEFRDIKPYRGGKIMLQVMQSFEEVKPESREDDTITTTLYDLIEAINEELQPGEEDLLVSVALGLAGDQIGGRTHGK